MDARKIYAMIKPQLDLLDNSEKITLSKLITSKAAEKITCHHRKVRPVSKAKEFLIKFRRQEMEREQNAQTGL
ncbi:hypothetical protein SAMN06296241_1999 [Salinimicrobium sediminis]|uniref:Uncharacterized protein n=1 Tax=Salinimicrobium sediminis TaxID=1343891 RepID=A0A285X7R2_9FLAO|nr:hypothetical protein [Salinimicrobium sediminis]SOC80449.1 hypothetical protein SAMN06296241_1999 [Salinimicrobium sediminis]